MTHPQPAQSDQRRSFADKSSQLKNKIAAIVEQGKNLKKTLLASIDKDKLEQINKKIK